MKEGLQPTNEEMKKNGDHKANRQDGIYTNPETGRKHISVTQIIDHTISKPALLQWRSNMAVEALKANPDWYGLPTTDAKKAVNDYVKDYTRKAMDRGSRVHSLAEAYLQGNAVYPVEGDEGYLAALEGWIEKHNVKILGTEETVYHGSGYAGTMDILARIGDEPTPRVCDLKSGGIYKEHLFQSAAYRQALIDDGLPVGGLMIVGLAPEGTFKTIAADSSEADRYYRGFEAAKTIYEVRNHKKLTELGYFQETNVDSNLPTKGGDSV